jgi:replication factor C subunit 2/4
MMSLLVSSNKKDYFFNKPLVEKYRPKTFSDIIFNSFLENKFERMIDENYIPNMIFTGEPSTGKTSTALFLASKMFDPKNILELNASDDRGINVISSLILPFCKRKTSSPKIIILDEADSITTKAQQLLGNIMDEFSEKVKIIYICNEYHKINEEIQTRSIIINFPKINTKSLKKKIIKICDDENISYNNESLDLLIFYSNNDIRQCLNFLECIMYNSNIVNNDIINRIIDKPDIDYIKNIIKYCEDKDLIKMLNEVKIITKKGFNSNDIILIFMKYLQSDIYNHKINQNEMYKIASKYYIIINNGVDTNLQLYSFICEIFLLNSNI